MADRTPSPRLENERIIEAWRAAERAITEAKRRADEIVRAQRAAARKQGGAA